MQKISFYLATNRIAVTTDTTGFITENRQVYQRQLKLYKGIDNTIEFEVKNSDQRKTPVVGYTVIVKFFDASHRNLFTASGQSIPNKLGLMTVIIQKDAIQNIQPQKLSMAAYLVDTNYNEKILYSDAQFGLFGGVELYDGYNEKHAMGDIIETITRFNYEIGMQSYVSEIATFGTKINDDFSTSPLLETVDSIHIEVFNNPDAIYEGDIQVQATQDKSTAIGNKWDTISTIKMGKFDGSTLSVSKTVFKTHDGTVTGIARDYKFLRFLYHKPDTGTNARFNIVRSNEQYSVEIANPGVGYNVGDRIRILGNELDGTVIANDLDIRVTEIDSLNSRKAISAVTVTGTAVPGDGTYLSKIGKNSFGTLDKIIIRN
jgi:hypothetical protein